MESLKSLVTSTIWMEDDETRIVWVTLVALGNKNGEVLASIPGLANVARVPVESCRKAVEKLLSPNADAATKDDDGRHLEVIEGGWRLRDNTRLRFLIARDATRASESARKREYRKRVAKTQGGDSK